jgi:hypothetical protein
MLERGTAWAPEVWHRSHPSAGQCWSSSYVLRSLLGGEIIVAEVVPTTVPKQRHSWNRFPSGLEVDLTREQYSPEQRFSECVVPESLVHSVAGKQAELLLARVQATLSSKVIFPGVAASDA